MRFCAGKWWAVKPSAIPFFSWETYFKVSHFTCSYFPSSQVFFSWFVVFLNLRANDLLIFLIK